MIKNAFLFLVSLVLSVTGFCQNTGKLLLKKGEKFLVEKKFTTSSTQEMMGQAMESKADFSISNTIEVKDIKDDSYNLTNTYTKLTLSMNAMGQDINFDSDKKEDMDGEMGNSVKDLIGNRKNIVVDKNGKITAEEDTARKDSGGEMLSTVLKQLMGNGEDSGFGLTESFMIIPAGAAVGFSWKDTSSDKGIKKSTTYTIKEIKGADALIAISGTLDADTKMEMQGMQIANKSNGNLSGEQLVDLKTGLVKERTTNVESSGTLKAMGQEIPTTTKITVVTTLKNI